MKNLKKLLLGAFAIVSSLSLTSCLGSDDNNYVAEVDERAYFESKVNYSNVTMRYLYEEIESLSAKVAKGEATSGTLVMGADGNPQSLTYDLADSYINSQLKRFSGTITINFSNGSPIADGAIKSVDLSDVIFLPELRDSYGGSYKMYVKGNIEIENETSTKRKVTTTGYSLGVDASTNDITTSGEFTITSSTSAYSISGSSRGTSVRYGSVTQQIDNALSAIINTNIVYLYFAAGSVTLTATQQVNLSPVVVTYKANGSKQITYNGTTTYY